MNKLRTRHPLTAPLRVHASIGNDGLTDAERSERANRYMSTAGNRSMSDAERAAVARALARRVAR